MREIDFSGVALVEDHEREVIGAQEALREGLLEDRGGSDEDLELRYALAPILPAVPTRLSSGTHAIC